MAGNKPGPNKGERNSGQFKPGQSGNPGGKPPLPDDLKTLIHKTGQQMKRDICEVYLMDLGELNSIAGATSGLSAGRAAIISCLNNSVQTGDDKAIKAMLDRILGKIPEAPPIDDNPAVGDHSKDDTISKLVELIVKEKR